MQLVILQSNWKTEEVGFTWFNMNQKQARKAEIENLLILLCIIYLSA
jgi:hypothetical protein